MMRCITPSPNIDPTYHYGATNGVGGLPLTANIESSDNLATPMRAMPARATRECSSSRDGSLAKTPPVGCEGVWPINDSLNAGDVASNRGSPNTGFNTSNVERSTDVDMDEGRMVDTANEDSEHRITTGPSRAPVLPTEFEGDVAKLKARLLAKGANEQAVVLCDTVFGGGVTIEALEKRLTREQCEALGVRDGKQFRLFLELVEGANGRMTERHQCRLCPRAKEYKNHRDALRHLLKDHFGLSFKCKLWSVF